MKNIINDTLCDIKFKVIAMSVRSRIYKRNRQQNCFNSKEKNLSSLELSFLCEMEKPNLIRIEKGRTNPTIKTLLKICKALQVDLKEIIP